MKKFMKLLIVVLGLFLFTNAYAEGYTVVSGDLNTVGSVVKIGSEEFYVIGKEDDSHIKLFAKYNLGAGNEFDTPTDKQDSTASAYVGEFAFRPWKGALGFASSLYWSNTTETGVHYVYNQNSTLYSHIEAYVTYLKTLGVKVTGRAISIEDLQELLNHGQEFEPGTLSEKVDDLTGKEWIYSTSYWTGTAIGSTNNVLMIMSNQDCNGQPYDITYLWGVRPVIVLELEKKEEPVKTETKKEEKVKGVTENPKTGSNYVMIISTVIALLTLSIAALILINKREIFKNM